jgi:hypothetical protein
MVEHSKSARGDKAHHTIYEGNNHLVDHSVHISELAQLKTLKDQRHEMILQYRASKQIDHPV